jgi:hypothetical protein
MDKPIRVWVEVPASPLPASNVAVRLQPITFDPRLSDDTLGHLVRLALDLVETATSGGVP